MSELTVTFFPPALPDLEAPDGPAGEGNQPEPIVLTGGFPGLGEGGLVSTQNFGTVDLGTFN